MSKESQKEQKPVVKYTKYQQGDVVMYRLEDSNQFEKYKSYSNYAKYIGKTNENAILAFGEVTGHTHRVEMSKMLENAGIKLHMENGRHAGKDVPRAFEVTGSEVELEHEEHDTVTLPPGKYVVKIVREFNHITRRAQYVAD
tara:strand:+ start:3857 stop:4282 length:426 start_codon:yes stop_codon:yes gene_type:complete